ncbi:MAG: gamma-glutamyl-gamma-aminobutyrate hydrolase family protein [Acidobacteriia bacterium]|nr:gamma-glutamyl-gamma-aminobutyrate hydrolase family protein [Terriglobia bacterium]
MPNRVGLTYRFDEKALSYERALREVGLEPVRLHPDQQPRTLEGLDGLLLSGGSDINPALYHQAPHPETDKPDDARDEMEGRLLRQVLERNLPVLAICRGMQLFNVLHPGGSLQQHIEEHSVRLPQAGLTAHTIAVEAGTRLAAIMGPGTQEVNSRHHQAVDRVGAGLRVSAVSPDGVIEGVERTDLRFAVAVQWHPEDRVLSSASDRKLFAALAKAVGS